MSDQGRLRLRQRVDGALCTFAGVLGAGEVERACDQEGADQGCQSQERDQREAPLNRHGFPVLRTEPHGLRSPSRGGVAIVPSAAGSLILTPILSSVRPILRLTASAASPAGKGTLARFNR